MKTRVIQTSKILLSITLCIALSFGSFFHVRKAEAIAPAIPLAGAALAELAAALGISEGALMAGIAAVGVAATGLTAYQLAGTDTSLEPAPGFKPWDDLTPQEKQDWVGQDGTAEDYQKQTIAWWAMQYGLLETDQNGNLQPTEPDPEDPNQNERLQKAKNVLIALSVGGGAVALNDALGPLVDNFASGIKGLLFGSNNLGLNYTYKVNLGGLDVNFATTSNRVAIGTSGYYIEPNMWMAHNPTNGYYCFNGVSYYYNSNMNPNINAYGQAQNNTIKSIAYPSGNGYAGYENRSSSLTLSEYPVLNLNWVGTYNFNINGTLYSYANQTWSRAPTTETVEYGQLSDTPAGLSSSVLNQNTYNTFINNYTNADVEGYKRAVTVPSGYGTDYTDASYGDFVVVTSETDITPIPGDSQIQPSPQPTPDTQFQTDLAQRVGQLLAQPLEQLFPFCLIADMRRLGQIFSGAAYGNGGMTTQSLEPMNGTMEFVIPLSGFKVQGLEDFTLDLEPISDLAHLVRPFMTALFIAGLLAGTLKFFLNRGGE